MAIENQAKRDPQFLHVRYDCEFDGSYGKEEYKDDSRKHLQETNLVFEKNAKSFKILNKPELIEKVNLLQLLKLYCDLKTL